jgi:hypothetical protein
VLFLARTSQLRSATIEGQNFPFGGVHPIRNLDHDFDAPIEPVEIPADDHLRLTGLDCLKGILQSRTLIERLPARDIKLLFDVEQIQAFALANFFNALTLNRGRHEGLTLTFSYATDPDNSNGVFGIHAHNPLLCIVATCTHFFVVI